MSPKAWSTSSPSTWWWPPSSPWPPPGPIPAGPPCTTWRRACGTRCATASSSTWCSRGSPSTRSTTPTASPSWSPSGRSPGAGRVQRQLRRATTASTMAERVLGVAARARRAGRPGRPGRGAAHPGRAGPRLRRALRRLHRDRGPLPGRPAPRAVGRGCRPRTRRPSASTRRSSTGPTTSTTSTCPRWSTTPGCGPTPAGRRWPAGRTGPAAAILSPERHLAAFDLENTLIASNVVESYAWLASRHLPVGERVALHGPDPARGAGAARPRPPRPGRLPAQLLPPLRRGPGRLAARRRRELFHHLLLTKSFPAGIARVRAHRALGHRTVLITGALDFVVEPLRPLFDEVVCARLGRDADGRFTGRLEQLPAHRRGAGPGPGRVRGGRRASISASPSPTPTRPRTCPCSSASASRWPSTPRPGWPPSPAGGAGTSSSGTRPGRRGRPPLPFGPARPRRVALVGPPRGHGRRAVADRTAGSRPAGRGGRRGEGPRLRAQPRPLRRRPAGRRSSAARARAPAVGPLRLTDVEPPELPGPGWHRVRPAAGRHLRVGPGHRRTAAARATSRTSSASPSSPATRWWGGRASPLDGLPADPGGRRAGARLRRPRHRPALPGVCRGPDGRLRAGRLRPPRAGAADRLLRRHRRRMVRRPGSWPTTPSSTPCPTTLSDDDAVMVEPTACAVHAALAAGVDAGRHRGRARRRAPWASSPWRPCASWPRPAPLLVGAKYAHQRDLAEELGADVAVDPDQLARAVRRRSRSLETSGTLTGGADVVVDCVGSAESLAQALGHGATPGPGRAGGHAGTVSASTWPRCGTARWRWPGAYAYGTEDVGGPAAPHLRPRHGGRGGRRASGGWCRPATRSTASKRPSPTPARPGAAARSRWCSTCAPDTPPAPVPHERTCP